MISVLDDEFEIMCYVKDTRAINGICTFKEVTEKFGHKPVTKLMAVDNLIGYDSNRSDGLDWTELGQDAMRPESLGFRRP